LERNPPPSLVLLNVKWTEATSINRYPLNHPRFGCVYDVRMAEKVDWTDGARGGVGAGAGAGGWHCGGIEANTFWFDSVGNDDIGYEVDTPRFFIEMSAVSAAHPLHFSVSYLLAHILS